MYYLIIPKKDEGDDIELFLHYGLYCGYRIKDFVLKAEFAGIGIITEKSEDIGERFYHSFAFGVLWGRGPIRPGIFYKLYIGIRKYINKHKYYVYWLNISNGW